MNGEMHTQSAKGAEHGRARRINDEASPEELQRDLERTRADLNATLHEIENRLSPGQIVDQALNYMGGPREFGRNLSAQVKDNPLPVSLIGIGLAWLMVGPRISTEHIQYTSEGIAEGAEQRYPRAGERVAQKQSELRLRLSAARERISHAAERMHERRGAAGEKGGETAERLREDMRSLMHDQPLAVGALAVAVGALLGAGLPMSRREHERMAPDTGEMMHRAREEGEHIKSAMKEGVVSGSAPPVTH